MEGAVLWQRASAPAAAGRPTLRLLPDGCLDLIWVGGALLVAGPDTAARVLAEEPPGTEYVGLRFAPGTGPAVLDVPAHELRDRQVPLADLWPTRRVRDLTDQLDQATRPGATLERIAADRLQDRGAPDPVMVGIAGLLGAGTPVAETATATGLSERQLHRRSLAAFGYGPKTLTRILRLNRALDLARAGSPYAAVAASTGYADQAHLAREVKALTGVPLGTLLA